EAEELALLVVPWRPDLNGLQRVAVLPTGMGEPALDVGGPGDQGILIPEADGLTEPLRHVLAEARDGAGDIELAIDMNIVNRISRSTEELHALRRDRDVERARATRPRPPPHEAFRTAIHERPLRR